MILTLAAICAIIKKQYLPVAQLDSASDSDSEGQRFESARAGHEENLICQPDKSGFLSLYPPFCRCVSTFFDFIYKR